MAIRIPVGSVVVEADTVKEALELLQRTEMAPRMRVDLATPPIRVEAAPDVVQPEADEDDADDEDDPADADDAAEEDESEAAPVVNRGGRPPSTNVTSHQVLLALRAGAMAPIDVRRALGIASKDALKRLAAPLLKRGLVEATGNKRSRRWTLSSAGHQAAKEGL